MYWDSIGIMEKKMETTVNGLRVLQERWNRNWRLLFMGSGANGGSVAPRNTGGPVYNSQHTTEKLFLGVLERAVLS